MRTGSVQGAQSSGGAVEGMISHTSSVFDLRETKTTEEH